MAKAPFILLVNPWITDFAAHDLWAKPLGLLLLAALLRQGGCGVAFIDCLDRYDPETHSRSGIRLGKDHKYGTGKYPKMKIPQPEAYAGFPRDYHRYGIHPESFSQKLQNFPRPDLIWVTSIMTYWYPGVQQTIAVLRSRFPDVPIWLGGIYAQLCHEHAREKSGADEIVTSPAAQLPDRIEATTGFALKNKACWNSFEAYPPPALDLIAHPRYAPVMTSRGCPFHCPYCASQILQPVWERRSARAVYEEILKWHETYGIFDFAFYDDALLLGADSDLKPALEKIAGQKLGLRFHTPNALHIRALTEEWCRLLYESGFITLRLGLETTQAVKQRQWGGKVETEMFFSAVERLRSAGFSRNRIGVYLLCGLPDQSPEEVAEAVRVVQEAGALPYLAEYSPIPGTPMWPQALRVSSYDLEKEPLFHNNSFFACRRPGFSHEDLVSLMGLARRARSLTLPQSSEA